MTDIAPKPIALPPELEPADTLPTPVNPGEPLGQCRHCRADVVPRTLAAAFADGLVCVKCDGPQGEPD